MVSQLCDFSDESTETLPFVNRSLGRSTSVAFTDPNLYTLGWIKLSISGFDAWGLLRAL
jgi:hypothetical protein